jgi:hypothetical protein
MPAEASPAGAGPAAGTEVARYLAAAREVNVEALLETLSAEPELVSPLSGRMVFRGRRDLRVLLAVVYGSLRRVRWHERVYDGDRCVVVGESLVGGVRRHDVTVFELDGAGKIRRIRPFIRPWFALSVDALVIGPRMALHPGIIWRALRPARAS